MALNACFRVESRARGPTPQRQEIGGEQAINRVREFAMPDTRPTVISDHARQHLVVRADDELSLLVVILDPNVEHGHALSVALLDGPHARDSVEGWVCRVRDVAIGAATHIPAMRAAQELAQQPCDRLLRPRQALPTKQPVAVAVHGPSLREISSIPSLHRLKSSATRRYSECLLQSRRLAFFFASSALLSSSRYARARRFSAGSLSAPSTQAALAQCSIRLREKGLLDCRELLSFVQSGEPTELLARCEHVPLDCRSDLEGSVTVSWRCVLGRLLMVALGQRTGASMTFGWS
jgi:hypothetical protein